MNSWFYKKGMTEVDCWSRLYGAELIESIEHYQGRLDMWRICFENALIKAIHGNDKGAIMSYKDKVKQVLVDFRDGKPDKKTGLRLEVYDVDQALSEIEKIYDERFELCVPSDLTTVMRDIIRFRWKETRQGD